MNSDGKQQVFEKLNFLLVATNADQTERYEQLKGTLEMHGCDSAEIYEEFKEVVPELSLELRKEWFYERFSRQGKEIHFIICESNKFIAYKVAAFDLLIPAVKPEWVSKSIEKNKLWKTAPYSPNNKHLYKQYEFYVSEFSFNIHEHFFYTQLILDMGGSVTEMLAEDTDYIVSRNFIDPSIKAVTDLGITESIKCVYPTWIIECHKLKTQTDYQPHIIDQNSMNQSTLWRTAHSMQFKLDCDNALHSQSFYIDPNFKIDPNMSKYLKTLINANGGTIEESITKNTNAALSYNSMENVDISANFIWLLFSINIGAPVKPELKIIFKPFKDPIFDHDTLNLSFTNYFGYQRYYIKLLTKLLGGIASTTFTKKNNFLISKMAKGKKFKTATATGWVHDCFTANHLWLEECYASEMRLDLADSRYTEIPPESILSSCINQRQWSPLFRESAEEDTQITEISTNVADRIRYELDNIESQHAGIHNLTNISDEPEPNEDLPSTMENEKIISHSIQVLKSGMELLTKTQSMNSSVVENTFSPRKSQSDKNDVLSSAGDFQTASPGLGKSAIEKANKKLEEKSVTPLEPHDNNGLSSSIPVTIILNSDESKKRTAELESNAIDTKKKKGATRITSSNNSFEEQSLQDNYESASYNLFNDLRISLINNNDGIDPYLDQQTLALLPQIPIRAVSTSCLDNLGSKDLKLLALLGINFHKEIRPEYNLNAIFAPKRLRTAKFLKSLTFDTLDFALTPDFITDLLDIIYQRTSSSATTLKDALKLDIEKYRIPEMSGSLLEKTALPTKVFERAHITKINVFKNIAKDINTIKDILLAHGIAEINVLNNKFTKADLLKNDTYNAEWSPDYVLIATSASQVKKFKQLLINPKINKTDQTNNTKNKEQPRILAVEWNWCVNSIFRLGVDYSESTDVIIGPSICKE